MARIPPVPIDRLEENHLWRDWFYKVGTLLNETATSSSTITTKDEGVVLSSSVTTLNFVGAGVVATGSGTETTITISGATIPDGDKGDITASSSGSIWTIDAGAVTLAKQADMATASLVYRKTAGSGAPEVNTLATLKTDLGLTGTNSGDQTTIVGITGTLAQFNTAVTDAELVPTTITISTTGPISGGGDLSANRTITTSMSTNTLIGRGTAGTGVMEEITLGTNLSLAGTTLNASGGGLSDGDKGDITVSAGGATWTIDSGVVTEAKLLLVDNTTNNASISAHGLMMKYPNTGGTTWLSDLGTWTVPVAAAGDFDSLLVSASTIAANKVRTIGGRLTINDGGGILTIDDTGALALV